MEFYRSGKTEKTEIISPEGSVPLRNTKNHCETGKTVAKCILTTAEREKPERNAKNGGGMHHDHVRLHFAPGFFIPQQDFRVPHEKFSFRCVNYRKTTGTIHFNMGIKKTGWLLKKSPVSRASVID
uniref:hypothetical protein n=1 Tax=uncultured Draconibacterium sp. TaxID=1573823 RepID=UPI0032177B02